MKVTLLVYFLVFSSFHEFIFQDIRRLSQPRLGCHQAKGARGAGRSGRAQEAEEERREPAGLSQEEEAQACQEAPEPRAGPRRGGIEARDGEEKAKEEPETEEAGIERGQAGGKLNQSFYFLFCCCYRCSNKT